MNVYIMNATINGKLLTEILVDKIPIKGMIGLDENGAGKTPEYYDYTKYCEKKGLKYLKMTTYGLTDESDRKALEELDVDLVIIASWQRLIPSWFIRRCRIGIIGAHGSHEGIVKGRGRSPQNWALMTGKNKFIFSIFWIEEGTDNGSVIETREFAYWPTDTILVSYIKLNLMKADMILTNLENGRIESKYGTVQNGESRYLPQRKKEDGKIDWNRDAVDIYNMVRALTRPYPGAYTMAGNKEFIIWIAIPVVLEESYLYAPMENGTVISVFNESILIKCGKNLLLVNSCTNFDEVRQGMVFESADYKEQMTEIVKRHEEKYGTPLSELVLEEINRH